MIFNAKNEDQRIRRVMKKKMFEELIKGAQEMADHAAVKEAKGVREVVRGVEPPTASPSKVRNRLLHLGV